MLCTVVCCQNDCDSLGVATVPHTALQMEIKSGSGLSSSVPVVVCDSIPTSEDMPVALQAM